MMSDPLIQDLLDVLFFNEDSADGGAAALWRGASSAGSLYVNLYSALPTQSSAGTIVSYTGYSEQSRARTTAGTHWTRTNQRISNDAEFDFGQRTNSGAAVVSKGWGISITSGDTTPQIFGPHWSADSFPAVTDDGGTHAGLADHLVADTHGLSDEDEVVILPIAGVGIPGGISLDTVYYVVNATTDDFQLETSIGGGAITFSSGGAVRVAKTVTLSITENLTPKIAAGALQIYGDQD